MIVERIRTDHGSHIEPPFDEAWDDVTKLQWKAAVTACDTGLTVSVRPGGLQRRVWPPNRWVDVPGTYSVQVGPSSCGGYDFDGAWTFLTGVSIGARRGGAL